MIEKNISIHAPSRERHAHFANVSPLTLFQSTLPRGSDICSSFSPTSTMAISIHAPSRERHNIAIRCYASLRISIHAPSRERHPAPGECEFRYEFQSTLPRGSDTGRWAGRLVQVQFQSTLPRGSDMKGMGFLPIIFKISIHAPSRERQYRHERHVHTNVISIHAPSRERQEVKADSFCI